MGGKAGHVDQSPLTYKEIEEAKSNLIHGEAVTAKDLKGKVILLEYWGTNCPPCRAGMPHLQKLHFLPTPDHFGLYSQKVTSMSNYSFSVVPHYKIKDVLALNI